MSKISLVISQKDIMSQVVDSLHIFDSQKHFAEIYVLIVGKMSFSTCLWWRDDSIWKWNLDPVG